ncbi:MAG: LLM class flavin-dependent oxidoreductase [Candidatus Rokubacteria bacterium]|nr:LLM class flavin-dependent oxidoreductase [Candidatus Rokubacteria bacterium]
MPLVGVLDQSPIRTGGTAAEAVAETVELAQACERWGYHRYWLAEHHASRGLAGSTPEVLVAHVAARTSRIRVGSGGVMLSHYSALKVAENFRMLETLYPGRIDLGIGRAPGSDPRTARALAHGPGTLGIEHFPAQIGNLLGFLRNDLPQGHPFRGIRAMPDGPTTPELWLLGSSDEGAALAARFGTAFAFAHFINDEGGAEVTRAYAARFRPGVLEAPRASVAVFALAADTEAEAQRLAKSRDLWITRLYTGRPGAFPSAEEAETYPYTEQELAIVHHARRRTIAGTPEQVRDRLLALAGAYGAAELMIVAITFDFKARLRSYQLLAEAFGLDPSADRPGGE